MDFGGEGRKEAERSGVGEERNNPKSRHSIEWRNLKTALPNNDFGLILCDCNVI